MKKVSTSFWESLFSLFSSWAYHVHDEKGTFSWFLMFFIVFDHANACTSMHSLVEIHITHTHNSHFQITIFVTSWTFFFFAHSIKNFFMAEQIFCILRGEPLINSRNKWNIFFHRKRDLKKTNFVSGHVSVMITNQKSQFLLKVGVAIKLFLSWWN